MSEYVDKARKELDRLEKAPPPPEQIGMMAFFWWQDHVDGAWEPDMVWYTVSPQFKPMWPIDKTSSHGTSPGTPEYNELIVRYRNGGKIYDACRRCRNLNGVDLFAGRMTATVALDTYKKMYQTIVDHYDRSVYAPKPWKIG